MKKRILLIEDDKILRENICEILISEGYVFESAINGIDGIKSIKKFNPDLIICDIMMPVMNGFEVLEELSKDEETASIPFIFLTAKVELENLRAGMRMGADDYLFKPFNIDDLLDAISARLKKKEISNGIINGIREQISAKVPHELRTPMVPILGYAELIEEENDIDSIKSMVRIIKKSAVQLKNKIEKFIIYKELIVNINDTKEPNKRSSCKFTQETLDKIIGDLSEEYNQSMRVKADIEPCRLNISNDDLHIMLSELLENGLKYSEKNKQVSLAGCLDGKYYKIVINDTGKGISEVNQKKISAYSKFGNEKLSEPGIGLGLAIVVKIVEKYDAKINIKSELGKFTSVELLINPAHDILCN